MPIPIASDGSEPQAPRPMGRQPSKRGGRLTKPDARDRQIEALQDRLSKLCEASRRINESLDLDAVLQGVLDSARSLTNSEYAVITTVDDSGVAEDFLVSGMTREESERLWEMPDGTKLFEHLSRIPGPLRVPDFTGFTRSIGLPDCRPPVSVSSFLAAPIRHRGVGVGNVYVAKRDPGREFSREDEETLEMFAAQVALVVANARRHRDEQRARADLETLINTSPVGVVVFDVRTGRARLVQPGGEKDRRRPAGAGPAAGATAGSSDLPARGRAGSIPPGVLPRAVAQHHGDGARRGDRDDGSGR